MDRLIFGHSFAEVVALILLPGLAFYFLNKNKASMRGDAEDSDTDTPSSSTTPTARTNSGGSSSTPPESANDASSSSTAPPGDSYEVFLSFSGKDTRLGFTDHLYHGLVDARIRTFRDNEELRRGKKIGDDLFAAIKNSKILIPILSVNYGTSRWCLDELAQIMECKNNNKETIVLPIFYKVAPADVRHQIGEFGDKFHKRERRLLTKRGFDSTMLKKWKESLEEVSSLKGHSATGPEGELVKSVVREVLSELITKFELDIPENLIGIDGQVEEVMKFVGNNSHATLFIGIHGMGGIGKTTIAKTIYNKLSKQFEYRSFIDDIRGSLKDGVKHLQNQLIGDILKQENLVRNKDEGFKLLSSKFQDRKVLILLDNVDAHDQLKDLAGSHDWFSSGSVIIITTRDEGILDKARVDYRHDHQVLDTDNSLTLFSRHAFREDSPPSEFEKFTDEVVSTTGRLPLSLKVLGSFLCNKPRGVWEDTIQQLRNVPNKEVQETLRITYDALEDEQQQIFLDIACFFIGTDLRIASYMWDACGFYPKKGIVVLRLMSLIRVGENHELRMHDQLRDLGREIVRQEDKKKPWNRSRLWDSKEVMKVLEEHEGTENIEAISLGFGRDDNILTGKQFEKLRNLRFLDVGRAHFSGEFENSIKKLKWLRWLDCPSKFEAKKFHVTELVVLDLSRSGISSYWQGWSFISMARKLKYLDLSACQSLEKTSFLSAFENLEVLILGYCPRIEQIDYSIGNMKSLVRLDLTICWNLKGLQAEVGKLVALEQLNLHGCRQLYSLPDNIGDLQNLEILNIRGTRIKELPNGIGRLRKLRELNASRCKKLGGKMPESVRNLSSLQRLDLDSCGKLQLPSLLPSSLTYLSVTCRSHRLPSLSNLTHLKELQFSNSELLESIWEHPSTLEKAINTSFELEILKLRGCILTETLDVSQFNRLRTLSIEKCYNVFEIRGLEKLQNLEKLKISDCASIKRLVLPKSKDLKRLRMYSCKNLVEIQGLAKLESLEEMDIRLSASIERLGLPKSKGLKKFKASICKNFLEIRGFDRLEFLKEIDICGCASISGCKNLVEIQGLDRLESVEEINIYGCASIRRLDLPKSKCLKKFYARGWENFVEIQGLDRLESLEEIDISRCSSIRRLDLPKSKCLKKFYASGCENLVEIQGLDRLESLEEIKIYGCASIRRLDLPKPKCLKKFYARGCENLVEIRGLDRLESLEKINIYGCASIRRLDLPKSKCLKKIYARGCKNLVEIQGLDRLESLEEIDISRCSLIRRLDLPKSKALKKLTFESCKNLFTIKGLDSLEFLEELNMSGCTTFGRLPDLCCFDTLRELAINCCDNLHGIQSLEKFSSCERLQIEDYKSLAEFPNLSNFHNLWTFFLLNCHELCEIPGLATSLQHIAILGCSSIGILPDFSSCTKLISLVVRDCEKLIELQGLEKLEYLEGLDISGCKSLKKLPTLRRTAIYRNYEKVPSSLYPAPIKYG